MPKKKEETSVALEAHTIIHGEKKEAYGPVAQSFQHIAVIATISCRKDITPGDVARILVAVKISREANKPARDNNRDGCGYLALLEQLKDEGIADISFFDQIFPDAEVPAKA